MEQNPIGLDGMEFIEYCGPSNQDLEKLFFRLGFQEIAQNKVQSQRLFRQGDVNFVLNEQTEGFARNFAKDHGPSICSTGFRVKDAQLAFEESVKRGVKPYEGDKSFEAPAVYGIGDSLIYFIDQYGEKGSCYTQFEFTATDLQPVGKGLTLIDHMTNNVPEGTMQQWCDFYENIFNFKERRFFDIKGGQTGLISKVMRSPCGKITIPINEPTDKKSQIQEYIDEYHGSGIQHVALMTEDICSSVAQLRADDIPVLDIPPTYYEAIPERLPQVTEDLGELEKLQVLVDGDEEGYLLQLFSQNLIGPIFFEFIQRKNHYGFGEGNFQALFEAIERDQEKRGVL